MIFQFSFFHESRKKSLEFFTISSLHFFFASLLIWTVRSCVRDPDFPAWIFFLHIIFQTFFSPCIGVPLIIPLKLHFAATAASWLVACWAKGSNQLTLLSHSNWPLFANQIRNFEISITYSVTGRQLKLRISLLNFILQTNPCILLKSLCLDRKLPQTQTDRQTDSQTVRVQRVDFIKWLISGS